jgi:hypothetical protein
LIDSPCRSATAFIGKKTISLESPLGDALSRKTTLELCMRVKLLLAAIENERLRIRRAIEES